DKTVTNKIKLNPFSNVIDCSLMDSLSNPCSSMSNTDASSNPPSFSRAIFSSRLARKR
ncbi:hypothetical protein D039_0218B, partial [Vibrio parahaemolyticus EKP-028]